MSKSANKYSVKSTVYVSHRSRGRSVDGPWKPTIEGAVKAFAEALEKKGLVGREVFRSFLAERCGEAEAPCKDSRGVPYREAKVDGFDQMLSAVGVRIGDLHRRPQLVESPKEAATGVIEENSRVRYRGVSRDGVWQGREGVAFSVDMLTGTCLVRWDDPDPIQVCFVSHSGVALSDLVPAG